MLISSYRAIRWLIVGVLCGAAIGQIAKEIPPGTSADAVIRAYGWPKGRAAAGDREIWTFEKFQVTLVNGRVISVSALPPSSTAPTGARAAAPRVTTAPAPSTIPARPSGQMKKMPEAAFAEAARKKPGYVLQEATPVVRSPAAGSVIGSTRGDESLRNKPAVTAPKREPSPKGAAAAPSGLFGWNTPLVWVMLPIIVALAAAKLWAARNRGMRTGKPNGAPVTMEGPAPRREPANWKEEIADRLARSKALEHSAQAASESAAPTRPEDALREAALQSGDLSRELLLALEWKRFESVVMEYFKATGVRAECTCTGADGGIDGLLYRRDEATPFSYVQCKAYGPKQYVDAEKVRSLYGVMAAAKVRQGVFVTTSEFGPAARTFARENNIDAINGVEFLARFAALPPDARATIIARVTEGDFTTPTCATHDVKMVKRVNGKDGSAFWACARPRCRRTLSVRSEAADTN